jgi:5-methylcytosine-specific restriction endonuclease McrA
MTEQQKQFLQLHIIEDKSYKDITQEMGVTRKELSLWYEEMRLERTAIANVKILWSRKQIKVPFAAFYSWYISQERICTYCGITESNIENLLDANLLATKRIATRGKKLELDRRRHDASYSDLDNLTLACYWCNNAKTDTFTAEEFKDVGQAFARIWQARLVILKSQSV